MQKIIDTWHRAEHVTSKISKGKKYENGPIRPGI